MIPLLLTAKLAADKYTSVAENAGEPVRDAQFLLAKLLNNLAGMQEYSSEQCAAANLGVPSSYYSDKMTYCYVHSAMRAVRNRIEERHFMDDGKEKESVASGALGKKAADVESDCGV